jgi:ATP-dependent Clp protease ATP-binding subunit ClpB
MHTLVGAGKAEGAMDASNLLKPALARGELHCIGATTLDEYRKHVEKDAALARRFQPVFVGEPTVEDTISILRGLKEKYELHHGVRITDARSSPRRRCRNRYITDRFLPDKAIDLMDEAASRLRWRSIPSPRRSRISTAIIQLKIEREALKKESDAGSKDRLQDARKGARQPRAAVGRADRALAGGEGQDRRAQKLKEQLDAGAHRARAGAAPRRPRARRRAAYGRIPELEKKLAEPRPRTKGEMMLREAVTARTSPQVVSRWTGIPVDGCWRASARSCSRWKSRSRQARDRPGRSGQGGLDRGAPRPRRPAGPQPADRLVPVPGARPASARPS